MGAKELSVHSITFFQRGWGRNELLERKEKKVRKKGGLKKEKRRFFAII